MDSIVNLDSQLTLAFYGWANSYPFIQKVFLGLAMMFIYILPLVLLGMFFLGQYRDRIASFKALVTALISWQVLSSLAGAFFYGMYGFRDRPFATYGLEELFIEQPIKAFPSDHSAVMFSVMLVFFSLRYPVLGWIFLVGGVLSAIGRVAVGFHFFGDILGGWLIGLLGFYLIRYLDKPVTVAGDFFARYLPGKGRTE